MEEDREATNLTSAPDELEAGGNAQAKQPKRRFVGRRAATAAAVNESSNSNIEDNGAIQGNYPSLTHNPFDSVLTESSSV